MNADLSQKFRVASLIATIMVVVRHSANIAAFYPQGGMPLWLSRFESGSVFMTDVAVPFFFFVSGFFFMRCSYYSLRKYWEMIKKKVHTLFVPFAVWSIVGALVLCVYDKEGALGNSLLACIHNFFMGYWYGPLWYVRDVMLLMLFYPIYGWMYKRIGQIVLIFVLVYLMTFRWNPGWCDLLPGEGVLFFLLGGLFQSYTWVLEKKSSALFSVSALAIWVVISFTCTSWDSIIHRVSILIGLLAFWMSLDLISGKLKDWCLQLAPYSFLIYVTHFYLHKVFKIGLALLFPENGIVALIAFFVVPVITVAIIVTVGRYWKQLHPKSYSICMGGRG